MSFIRNPVRNRVRSRLGRACVPSLSLAVAALLGVASSGCGSPGTIPTNSFGPIPDVGIYDTGFGGGLSGDVGGYYGDDTGEPSDVVSTPDVAVEVAPSCDDSLKRCPHTFTYPYKGETSVELRGDYRDGAWTAGDAMTNVAGVWTVTVPIPWNTTVQYKFWVNGTTWETDPNNPAIVVDSSGNTNSALGPSTCDDFTCAEPPALPPGVFDWRDAVIYFVFVDRFFDGDPTNNGTPVAGVDTPANYQGGDWAGVTQKINAGYFNDLGVNALWITVPFQNADTYAGAGTTTGDNHLYSSYHGYWGLDPTQPETRFGTLDELKTMIASAHAKSLKILFDYVMVDLHTSSSIYIDNKDWFWPENNADGSSCICGAAECPYTNPTQLQCWFTPYLAHWDYTVPAARDASVAQAMQWAALGIDGFRLDAIKQIDTSWLTELRTQIQATIVAPESPQQRFYMVGETYDFSNVALIKSFIDPATMLDGQFDFPLRLNLVESILMRTNGIDSLASFMDGNDNYYGTDAVMSPFVGNADLPRSIHIGDDTPPWPGDVYNNGSSLAWADPLLTLPTNTSAFERLANAFAVIFTNRGAPLIYYGDEWGMPGAGDPDNRRFMEWTGYTSNQTWLNTRVKALLATRAAHPAFRRGTRSTLSVTPSLWVYKMESIDDGDTVYVAINPTDDDQTATSLPAEALSEVLTATDITGPSTTIPARQTRIFVSK